MKKGLIRKVFLLLTIGWLFSSCAARQLKMENERRAKAEALRPSWCRSTVGQDRDYYWGAGAVVLSKEARVDAYRKDQVRRSALNEIAGQISVKIASQSIFSNTSVSERAKTVISQYVQQTIRLTSQEHLDGVECVDRYEDEFGYFELYRLSVSSYWEGRRRRVAMARDEAFELLDKAEESRRGDDYRSAILYSMKALQRVSEHAEDDLAGEWRGRSGANPLVESDRFLSRTIGDMTLSSLSPLLKGRPGELVDGSRFGFRLLSSSGRPIAGIKLDFKTEGMILPVASAFTDGGGRWSMPYRLAVGQSMQSSLTASVDLLPIISSGGIRHEIGQIVLAYPVAPARIVVQMQAPQMRIVALGEDLNGDRVAQVVTDEFARKGVEVSPSVGVPLRVAVSSQTTRRTNYMSANYLIRLSWTTPQGEERSTTLAFTESAVVESELSPRFLQSLEKELRNRVVKQVMDSMF